MINLLVFNPITLLIVYILYTKSTGITLKVLTIVGGIIDIVVNVTWFTVIFFELPKELLLTKRIERLKANAGWRGAIAWRLCDLLNYFAKDHCK